MLRKSLAIAAAAILAIYLGICGLLYGSQRAYLYFPVPRRAEVPSFVMTSGDADVVVSTNGVDSPQAVLYFGGNAEDVARRNHPDRAKVVLGTHRFMQQLIGEG